MVFGGTLARLAPLSSTVPRGSTTQGPTKSAHPQLLGLQGSSSAPGRGSCEWWVLLVVLCGGYLQIFEE